jgi:Glutamyl- and glutaminyl-tRNA synthetases
MTVARFAPSPTGLLHAGNLRTALLNALLARRAGGRFLLRFDDTDAARSQERFVEAAREDLRWLGLKWDEEIRQSARLDRYAAAADRLRAAGRLYPCYETPDELERRRRLQRAAGLPPVYDRAALALSAADRAGLEAEAGALTP